MAAAASTIPERLGSPILAGGEPAQDKVLLARLQIWCQSSTGGDWQRFQERLSWDGLDLAGARRLLAPGVWSKEIPLPEWITTLQQALDLLETLPGQGSRAAAQYTFLDAAKPLPFEELLVPFERERFGRVQESVLR